MGNILPFSHYDNDHNEVNNCDLNEVYAATDSKHDIDSTTKELSIENKEKLNEFKIELARKHEKRKEIIEGKRKEMEALREENVRLKEENVELKKTLTTTENVTISIGEYEQLKNENEFLKDVLEKKSKLLDEKEVIIEKNRELKISIAGLQKELQDLNVEVLDFEKERQDYRAHVVALKDVIALSKHMLQIRESQLKELKEKVESIEESLAGREMNILSQDLRNEYDRQLQNIRNLRTLYEERQRVERREKDEILSQLDEARKETEAEKQKSSELEENIQRLEADNSKKYDEIKVLESSWGLSKAEGRQYQAELAVINQLFSEILLGFNSSQDIDLDRLQKHLEEHHDLLQDIVVNEISSEVSYALPKVFLDLVNQVDNREKSDDAFASELEVGKLETIPEESESQTSTIHHQMNSAEEIVENLPKVWRVLIELLSHQKPPMNTLTEDEEDENPCYKTVQTPKGPSLVLSVSQTFIRLKDLILEKKSLEKETNNLKQLNGHLENRLQDHEKRLELVQNELSKTWHVVGKLQKQHQLLHTQEKILRYELAQKRKLLTELKGELEYSREKWAQAREKNSNTEKEWRKLRNEFAARRNTIANDDLNNSVESGYSDDRECTSSDEEPGYETDVSECAKKVIGVENTEETILEEGEIEGKVVEEGDVREESCVAMQDENEASETNEVVVPEVSTDDDASHSLTKELKTDLVQSKSDQKTDGSSSPAGPSSEMSFEERLARKDERLKRLEGQANRLVTQVTNTENKRLMISNKLDNLHDTYGQDGNSRQDVVDNETASLNVDENDIETKTGNPSGERLEEEEVVSNNCEVPSESSILDVEVLNSNDDNNQE